MKYIVLLLSTLFFCNLSQAQDSTKASKKERNNALKSQIAKQEEEGVITYTRHFLGGIKLNTDGYGGFIEIGRGKSINKATLFQLEISEKKHPKEDKFFDPSRTLEPVIYGKINYFYPVKIGVQQQFTLGNKGNRNGVFISGNIGGGPSIGLLRPYQLLIEKNGEQQYIGYDSPDSLLFLTGPYFGGPGFFTGFNKLKITPGVYVKPAIRFDYGKFNELVSAIEIGLSVEYYSKKIPFLVYNKPENLFFSGYVSILFGKRKN